MSGIQVFFSLPNRTSIHERAYSEWEAGGDGHTHTSSGPPHSQWAKGNGDGNWNARTYVHPPHHASGQLPGNPMIHNCDPKDVPQTTGSDSETHTQLLPRQQQQRPKLVATWRTKKEHRE